MMSGMRTFVVDGWRAEIVSTDRMVLATSPTGEKFLFSKTAWDAVWDSASTDNRGGDTLVWVSNALKLEPAHPLAQWVDFELFAMASPKGGKK